jgi:hypothetical protein
MEDESNFDTIRTRPAKSGRVNYGDPVILHDTTKSRVVMVPFFVQHTLHVELAVKIITYKKEKLQDWALVEQKSVSLREDCSRKLLRALQTHLQVAETGETGSYIVVRVSEGTANLGSHDPSKVAQALTKVLTQPEILQHLDKTELSSSLLDAMRGAIRLTEMRTAVASLRQSLANGECGEPIYQTWCEKHSWAFGNAYVLRDEVRNISTGDKLDLLLPNVIAGYRDIIELKRPDMQVLLFDEAHRNYYFASEVSKAIGQCHRYLDILHEEAANGLRDHPEIVAYHPRAIIVIGRSFDWDEAKLRGLHGLNRRLSGITIMTYDQLLLQGERLIEMLGPADNVPIALEEVTEDEDFDNDDPPF